jgi:hypothetical protein
MELNARHSLAFAEIVIDECPCIHGCGVDFATRSCLFVSKHLKIVLEDVDDFVGLQGFFNSESNSVQELVKFVRELFSLSLLFFGLLVGCGIIGVSYEIVRRVLYRLINTSTKDSLSLDSLHLVGCLQTHIENLLLGDVINILDLTLQVHGVL